MAVWTTLDAAKKQVGVTTTAGDPDEVDLQRRLDAAEAIVLDYVKTPYDPATATPAQAAILESAILLELGELYGFRGDNLETQKRQAADGYLIPIVTAVLHRLRDPALG